MTGAPARPRVLVSFPAPRPASNPFLAAFLRHVGEHADLTTYSWRSVLTARLDLLHLHWPEYLASGRSPLRTVLAAGVALLLLARVVVQRIPVVWTVHNLRPHDRERSLPARIGSLFRRRVGLELYLNESPENSDDGVTILHGDYRELFDGAPGPIPTDDRVLYLGLLRPYKGVEELVRAFRDLDPRRGSLTIAGAPASVEYGRAVRAVGEKDPDIRWDLRHVPEPELLRLIAASSLVALPYRQLYNSGSVLLALTAGRPVLAPRTGSTESLAVEVGPGWVTLFDAPLEPAALLSALEAASIRTAAPDLSRRDWSTIGALHGALYRWVITEARRSRRGWPAAARALVATDAAFTAHSTRNR